MTEQDYLAIARVVLGELSLPVEEGRTRELAKDISVLYRNSAGVRERLEFDQLPGDFRRVLKSSAFPIPTPTDTQSAIVAAVSSEAVDITDQDLVVAAESVRAGRVSSRELVSACLARIERLQPLLNCFIEIDAQTALADADRADAARARGELTGRLHGVPLAHKDMFYREGGKCSCGSKIRKDFRAATTATVLTRLDAQGAVTVGRLNTVEFAAGGTGHNGTFGDCRNPWNPAYSAGGSSSGSGSAVAARLVYGALGSDTGGSVRLPAAMCGVVGLKPTRGRVSCYGIMPRSWSTDVVGPLTRSARDCARLLGILAGPDPMDPDCTDIAVPNYEAQLSLGMYGVKVGVPRGGALAGVAAEIVEALEQARVTLKHLGATLIEVDLPDIDALFALAEIILKAEAASLHERWIRDRPHDYDLGVRSHAETGLFIPAVRYMEAQRLRGSLLQDFLSSTLSKADMVMAPVLAEPVPTLDACKPTTTGRAAVGMAKLPYWTRWVNYLGVPAIAVPCGMGAEGLPISFQLIGRPFREDLLLRVAHVYEEAMPWHHRIPSGVTSGQR